VKLYTSVDSKHCPESAATSREVGGISTELLKNVQSQIKWRPSQKPVVRAKKISLAKESRELDKTAEQEISKDNSMTSITRLNLLLYVACITMGILFADKIKFWLSYMCSP
jgi:hypothetical protein